MRGPSTVSLIWWSGLCVAAAANLAAWAASARALRRRRSRWPADAYQNRWRLLWLSGSYVLGCGFRSVLPMLDVPRLCLHDTRISRIVVGRSVATVAELAFAVQWALLLGEAGATRAARAVVALIAGAQVLCWLAVLTTYELFHAAENAVWTLAAVVVAASLASRWGLVDRPARRVIAAAVGCAAAYVAFMVIYVVPMYVIRWQADVTAGRHSLSLADGLRQLLARCRVETDWVRWVADAAWLTPYFTLAVWISIGLAHLPSLTVHRPGGANGPHVRSR